MNDTTNNLTEPQTLNDVIPPPTPVPEAKKIIVTEEDKERFFKSFLSDTPFEDTLSRLDGRLKITLRTLTVDENYDVFRQIDLDRETKRAKNEDSYLMVVVQYRLALSLVAVNGAAFCPGVTKLDSETKDGRSYVQQRIAGIQGWPVHKLAAFVDTFNSFEAKVQKLTMEIENPDFWKAGA